ncbi:MAG: hypothetical protein J6386_02025 [Candidatus Synoicihabitans palmerolidicus]|nr:hypothetical protein [Candidatus Synoicihabitans palmerolidicus]
MSPGGEDERVDPGGVHLAAEGGAELLFVLAALDGGRILVWRERVDGVAYADLVEGMQ